MPIDDDLAIRAVGLRKRFGSFTALDGVDLTVQRGSVHAVLGPNGAGKTTLVRLLTTLTRLDDGDATVMGYDVRHQAGKVRRSIALTGQYASLDESLTGAENLFLLARLLGMPRLSARVRADELLEQFGLTAAAKRQVRTYSGGMRRRLDIAASLLANPPLIFLDEPTTGLDPRTRQDMWDTVRSLVTDGTTVLLTTQYLEEADELADVITVVDRGRVVATDTAAGLKRTVGGTTLTITLRHVDDVALAVSIVDNVAELMGISDRARADGTSVSIASADGDMLSRSLTRLDLYKIEIDSAEIRQPSLDEVFFALTQPSAAAKEALA